LEADVEIDVDCEFDKDGVVYLWGALLSKSGVDKPSYRIFSDRSSNPDEKALARAFNEWLAGQLKGGVASTRRWYHYGPIENRRLRRILGAQADSVLGMGVDVLTDVIRPDFYAPAGFSLKKLAIAAGANWRTEGASGLDTFGWLSEARDGDHAAWDRLVEYNEDDTHALRILRKAIVGTSPGWVLRDELEE
jgi:predicted RecB family nuclease